jgi:plasmid maintenance system killer protein
MAYTFSDDELELLEELAEHRHLASSHTDAASEIRDRLMKILEASEADKALTSSGAPAAHVETQHRRTVNTKKLEALYPEQYADCMDEKEVLILKVDLP